MPSGPIRRVQTCCCPISPSIYHTNAANARLLSYKSVASLIKTHYAFSKTEDPDYQRWSPALSNIADSETTPASAYTLSKQIQLVPACPPDHFPGTLVFSFAITGKPQPSVVHPTGHLALGSRSIFQPVCEHMLRSIFTAAIQRGWCEAWSSGVFSFTSHT